MSIHSTWPHGTTPARVPVITISRSKVMFYEPHRDTARPWETALRRAAVVELRLSARAEARLAVYAQRFTDGDEEQALREALQLGLHLNGRTLSRVEELEEETITRHLVLGQRELTQVQPVARAAALGAQDAVQTIVRLGLEALAYLLV